jgi:hypothetical protein
MPKAAMLAHSLTIAIVLKRLLRVLHLPCLHDALAATQATKGSVFQLPVMLIVAEGQEMVLSMSGEGSELWAQMSMVLTVITMAGVVSSKLCFWFPKTLGLTAEKPPP